MLTERGIERVALTGVLPAKVRVVTRLPESAVEADTLDECLSYGLRLGEIKIPAVRVVDHDNLADDAIFYSRKVCDDNHFLSYY